MLQNKRLFYKASFFTSFFLLTLIIKNISPPITTNNNKDNKGLTNNQEIDIINKLNDTPTNKETSQIELITIFPKNGI